MVILTNNNFRALYELLAAEVRKLFLQSDPY